MGQSTDVTRQSEVLPNGFRRDDLVRLITQSLYSLGCNRSAKLVEEETGTLLQLPAISEFRAGILNGDWSLVESLLPQLYIEDLGDFNTVRFLVLEQKYLECLENRETREALDVIRKELTPLKLFKPRLHKLTSLVMCPDPDNLKEVAEWDGAEGKSRHILLKQLQKYISPSLLIPEDRLSSLLKQAVQYQTANCMFHNIREETYSLFEDHKCSSYQIPRETQRILESHTDEVWHVQFSHDGTRLASASKDCTAIIWDVMHPDMPVVHQLSGHSKALSFLAWSPDDTMLLTCGNDETVKLWDTESGEMIRSYENHTNAVTACAWFPNGRRFVSGGIDKHIMLWDLDGTNLYTWTWTGARIHDLTISRDAKLMVAITSEKSIVLCNVEGENRDEIGCIKEPESITSLCLSNCSRYLLVNIQHPCQEIHMWDLVEKRCVQKYQGQKQSRFVIRSTFGGINQSFIVSGSEDSRVYIWHRATETPLAVLEGHSGTVNALSWSPTNPHMFASGSDDHTIRIWGRCQSKIKEEEGEEKLTVRSAWM